MRKTLVCAFAVLGLQIATSQDIYWLTATSGPWETTSNWFSGVAPDTSTGSRDVYIDFTPHLLTGSIGSFTTNMNASATINRLFTRAHFVQNDGTLTLNSTGSVVSGSYTLNGGTLTGANLTLAGAFNFNGGALSGGNLVANGGFNIGAGNTKNVGRNIQATGGTWSGGDPYTVNTAFTNVGTFNITGDNIWYDGVINNSGTIRKIGGTGISYLNYSYNGGPRGTNNSGSITASTGTLQLTTDGTHSGSFSGSGTGSVSFGGGTHTMAPGVTMGNNVNLDGATINLNSTTLTFNGNTNWNLGVINGPGTLAGNTLRATSGNGKGLGGTVANSGNFLFNDGSIFAVNSTLNNSGTLNMAGDLIWYDGVINNSGTVTKSSGAGAGYLAQNYNGGPREVNNSGTLTCSSGVLYLPSGGSHSGSFSGSGGGLVSLNSGTHTVLPGCSMGNGVHLDGATVSLNGNTLNLSGTVDWNLGTVSGGGTISNGVFHLTTGNGKSLANTVTGTSSWLWDDGSVYAVNSTFNNNGTLTIAGDLNWYDGVINNHGSVIKSAGAGAASPCATYNGGPSYLQNDGLVRSDSGTIWMGKSATHSGTFSATGSGIVSFAAGTHTLSGATLATGVNIDGASMELVNGTINGSVNFNTGTLGGTGTLAGGTLKITTGNGHTIASSPKRSGLTQWLDGSVYGVNATFNNQGNFQILSDLNWYDGMINNTGTLTKSSGSADAALCATYVGGPRGVDNSGTVSSSSGRLLLYSSTSNSTGVFTSSGSGSVLFAGGDSNLNDGASITGTHVGVLGGNTNVVGTIPASQFWVEGGTLNDAGTFNVSGPFHFLVGTITGSGILNASGGMLLDTANNKTINATRVNIGGSSTWSDGTVFAVNSTVNIAGSFNILNDLIMYDGVFNNSGSITKTGGAGVAGFASAYYGGPREFNNSGSVSCSSGDFQVGLADAPGTHTGLFTASGTGHTSFVGGTQTMNAGGSFGDKVRLVGGTLVLNSAIPITGEFDFQTSVMTGSGSLTGGLLTLSTGGGKTFGGSLTRVGPTTWKEGPVFAVNSTFTNQGVMDIQFDAGFYDGILINNGEIDKTAGAGGCYLNSAYYGGPRSFTNNGILDVRSGSIYLAGTHTNYNGGSQTLAGGTYRVRTNCNMVFPHPDIVTSASTIELFGPNSNMVDNSSQDALRNFNNNLGSFKIQQGRDFARTGSFDTSGDVLVGSGSTFNATTSLNESNGYVQIDGTLTTPLVDIAGGTFAGTGTVNGAISNHDGEMAPGSPTGILHEVGNYTQTSNGAFDVLLRGHEPGNISQLSVTGNVSLSGGLSVEVSAGFAANVNDTFRIISCSGTRSGTFSSVPDPLDWFVIYGPNFVDIRALRPIGPPAPISGHITLQDFIASPASQAVTMEFRSGNTVVDSRIVNLNPSSDFAFQTRLRGTYTVTVQGNHWLRKAYSSQVTISDAGLSGLNFSLENGDIDGDNEITLVDYSELAQAFGSTPEDGNWNPTADLDGDEEVTLADYSILSRNFGHVGDD